MRVLVADKFEQSGLDALASAGCEVLFAPALADQTLVAAIAADRPEIVIVRSTKVSADALAAGPLSLVVRAGAGVNTIDVAAASALGIYVANCPGKNAVAVAELTLGLLLALDRRIPDAVADLRAGRWNKQEYSRASGLAGSTLGVLGLGAIGCEVVRRAHAFGIRIVAWSRRFAGEDRWLTVAEARELGLESVHQQAPIRLAATPAAVAGGCDALTVHVALSAETRGWIDAQILSRLRDGGIFLNTSRGEIVDAAALTAAVRDRGIRAGLDVFALEPAGGTGEFRDPIVDFPGVYGTHHVGASTEQAQEAIAAETVRVVRSFIETGRVPNCVNLASKSPANWRLDVRHRDRPGVLAHVFARVRAAGMNVQETENLLFSGGRAALARVHLVGEPVADLIEQIRTGDENILDLRLTPI